MAMDMQTLKTGSLCLEPLTVAHAEAMFDVLADAEIYRYLDYPAPPSVEHLRNLYARLEKRQSPDGSEAWLNWVVRRPGETPMGYVQSTVLPNGDAWVAYVLNSRHWGGGVAHAATQEMMAHLASACGVKRYMAMVEVENVRSIRLLERLGFRLASASEAGAHELTASERLYLK
jgi:[ribosomal protein S5]-alanine N-acetyltransferase